MIDFDIKDDEDLEDWFEVTLPTLVDMGVRYHNHNYLP